MDAAAQIASDVIRELEDRSGFDHWWGDLGKDIQDEILGAIAGIIQSGVEWA